MMMTDRSRQTLGRRFASCAALAVLLGLAAGPAHAGSEYLDTFAATYPDAAGTRIDACRLCHTSGSQRNAYGSAFGSADRQFAPIEAADSDGDGFSNLDEILALTFPGDAADAPVVEATPTPTATPVPTATPPAGACTADCNADGAVAIDELVRAVNIALGSLAGDSCAAADRNGNGTVSIDELLAAVNAALSGCPTV